MCKHYITPKLANWTVVPASHSPPYTNRLLLSSSWSYQHCWFLVNNFWLLDNYTQNIRNMACCSSTLSHLPKRIKSFYRHTHLPPCIGEAKHLIACSYHHRWFFAKALCVESIIIICILVRSSNYCTCLCWLVIYYCLKVPNETELFSVPVGDISIWKWCEFNWIHLIQCRWCLPYYLRP